MPPDSHIPYETLGRYLARKIDRDERASVERHLKDCEYCRKDLEDAQSWQAQLPVNESPFKPMHWIALGIFAVVAISTVIYFAVLR